MRTGRLLTRRVLALAGSVILLAGSIAVPASVGAAERAAHTNTARGTVTDRGRIDARAAAKAAAASPRALPAPRAPLRAGPKHLKEGPASLRATTGKDAPRITSVSPVVVQSFPGNGDDRDGLSLEPPDPWIAVNASYVVQATNGLVRMSTRSGAEVLAVPTWAMFGLYPDESDSDPRILWDPTHSRWVGVLLAYVETVDGISSGALLLAVSETADPTGAWDVRGYAYDEPSGLNAALPDYPGLSSSSDKIVMTANVFDHLETSYLGASLIVVRWSDILSGTPSAPVLWTADDPSLITIRPAIVQSASSDVHLVAEDASTGDLLYAKLSGSAPASPTWFIPSGSSPFCSTNQPSQPGVPATISNAVDERPTDAVWQSDVLALVSTCAFLGDDFVRVTRLSTSGTPTVLTDELIGPGSGTDSYMGGIGYTRDGSLVLSYTESSTSQYASTHITSQNGGSWTSPALVQPGGATYLGGRWGDYVGVATDPTGTGAVWAANQYADAGGSWATQVMRIAVDGLAPSVSGPTQALIAGTAVGSQVDSGAVPVKVSWTATDTGSGIDGSRLRVNQFGTGFVAAGSTRTATTLTRNHFWRLSTDVWDSSYAYSVVATDAYGNVSSEVPGPTLTPVVYKETTGTTYAGTWRTTTSTSYLNGAARYASTAGASATFKTSGRSFGFVTTRASTRGKVKVYLDGVYKGTVTLTSSATRYRTLAYVVSFPSSGTHTIKLVVASGRVDVDGFVVLR